MRFIISPTRFKQHFVVHNPYTLVAFAVPLRGVSSRKAWFEGDPFELVFEAYGLFRTGEVLLEY